MEACPRQNWLFPGAEAGRCQSAAPGLRPVSSAEPGCRTRGARSRPTRSSSTHCGRDCSGGGSRTRDTWVRHGAAGAVVQPLRAGGGLGAKASSRRPPARLEHRLDTALPCEQPRPLLSPGSVSPVHFSRSDARAAAASALSGSWVCVKGAALPGPGSRPGDRSSPLPVRALRALVLPGGVISLRPWAPEAGAALGSDSGRRGGPAPSSQAGLWSERTAGIWPRLVRPSTEQGLKKKKRAFLYHFIHLLFIR